MNYFLDMFISVIIIVSCMVAYTEKNKWTHRVCEKLKPGLNPPLGVVRLGQCPLFGVDVFVLFLLGMNVLNMIYKVLDYLTVWTTYYFNNITCKFMQECPSGLCILLLIYIIFLHWKPAVSVLDFGGLSGLGLGPAGHCVTTIRYLEKTLLITLIVPLPPKCIQLFH